MVTGNANPAPKFTTYDPDTDGYQSPTNGTSGYSTSVAGQTREYYGASDVSVYGIGNNGGASGDAIQMVRNFDGASGSATSMIAWQQADFLNLSSGSAGVTSFDMEFKSRGGVGSTAYYLIETGDGWYQSQGFTNDDYTSTAMAIGDLTWSGFSEFGVTDGTVLDATADTDAVSSVGAYFTNSITNGTWTGTKLQYFNVTAVAVPEPSSAALLGLGGLALILRRRR